MAKPKVAYLKKVEDEDYVNHSTQFLEFVAGYVETGDAKASWVEAGFSKNTQNLAMNRLRNNWRMVERMIQDRIGNHVPMALNGIIGLAQNAKQDSIKLKAQQDILYRAGYDKPIEYSVSDKDATELKDSELKDELARLLKIA
jgi:hypothetical protein